MVRVKKEIRRKDGSYIRFDDNASWVVDESGQMKVCVFGPVARELRDNDFMKVVSKTWSFIKIKMTKLNLKKDDTVIVISGTSKGKQGKNYKSNTILNSTNVTVVGYTKLMLTHKEVFWNKNRQ